MKLYKSISVDLYDPYPLKSLNVKQNDIGRGAYVTLTAGGSYLDPAGSAVRVFACKPDGTKVYSNCEISEKKVQIDFTNQMLALPGVLQVEIELTEGKDRLSTPIFRINVLPTNMDESAIESSNEYSVLQELIEKSGSVIENAETVTNAASDAANAASSAATKADSAATAAEEGATAASSAATAANKAASSANSGADAATKAAAAANKAADMINITDLTEDDLQAVWDAIVIEETAETPSIIEDEPNVVSGEEVVKE